MAVFTCFDQFTCFPHLFSPVFHLFPACFSHVRHLLFRYVSIGVGNIPKVRQRDNALQEASPAHQLCKMHLPKLRYILPWVFLTLRTSGTCLNLGNPPSYESMNNYTTLNTYRRDTPIVTMYSSPNRN